jgi:ATP-dependent protease ClpP protease subunit
MANDAAQSTINLQQPPNLDAQLASIEAGKQKIRLRCHDMGSQKEIPRKTPKEIFSGRYPVVFAGEIDRYSVNTFIEKCRHAVNSSNESILVHMSTNGGEAEEAVRMYEQIQQLAAIKPVDIRVSGRCHSAGVWVMMAVPVEDRWISSHSDLMIHPMTVHDRDYNAIPRHMLSDFQIDQLAHLNRRWIIDEISNGSSIRRGDLEALVADGSLKVYLTARQSVELGLFAGIV